MSGRVMIVDPVSTNRIVLKVKLLAARYGVIPCASFEEALARIESETPDLVLVEACQMAEGLADFCQRLRQCRLPVEVPVLALGHFAGSADRLAALWAGADDLLPKPFGDALLLARIRSLLRARDESHEPILPDETRRALGFAEKAVGFDAAGSIAIVSDDVLGRRKIGLALAGLRTGQTRLLDTIAALELRGGAVPDLFVIDARGAETAKAQDSLYRLIADLRSRTETRNAAQIVVLPEGADSMAAMALDLGANATIDADAAPEEFSHRARQCLARKAVQDRLRDTLKSGLEAAMTDPLTGLSNRRFAMSHLAGLVERAQETGRSLAVMVLDIDHFKRINDVFGHPAGDKVLVGVADLLKRNLRAVDLIARIGGEEFLIAMPDACGDAARAAAERLRRKIESTPFGDPDTGPIGITLSVGIAVAGLGPLAGEAGLDDLILRADTALYRSKADGRNMVTLGQSAA